MALTLTVGVVEQALHAGSMEVLQTINGRSSMRCRIWDPTGFYTPIFNSDVEVEDDSGTVFKGLITRIDNDYPNFGLGRFVALEAADYSHYADLRVIRAATSGGITGRDAADYIVDNYLSVYGVTRDSAMQAGGTLGALSFDYVKVGEALDEILRLVAADGWCWRIDENKILTAFLPSVGAYPCPFTVEDGDTHLVGDVRIRRPYDTFANRVIYSYVDADNVPVSTISEDASLISAYGVHEVAITNHEHLDASTAQSLGDAYLANLSSLAPEIEFVTMEPGARAGQTVTVDLGDRISGDFLIQQVRLWDADGKNVFYAISAVEGAARKDHWKQTYRLWARSAVSDIGGFRDGGVNPNPIRVQSTGIFRTTSAVSLSGSFGSLPAVGSLVLVGVHGTGLANWTAGDVTDNQGNTYGVAVAVNGSNDCAIFYTVVATSAGTFTITINPANLGLTGMVFSASEYSGTWDAGTCVDQTATNTGTGSTITSGTTATTSAANELVAAIFVHLSNQSSITAQSVTPAWTEEHEELGAGGYIPGEFSTRVVTAIGAQSCQWTGSASNSFAACIATFRGA